jgi:hypothetical protein
MIVLSATWAELEGGDQVVRAAGLGIAVSASNGQRRPGQLSRQGPEVLRPTPPSPCRHGRSVDGPQQTARPRTLGHPIDHLVAGPGWVRAPR